MKKLSLLAALWAVLSLQFSASAQLKGLDFLKRESIKKVFKYSLKERKPVAVFVYSEHCYESRQFAREVMNNFDIGYFLKRKFNCVLADIANGDGKDFANKNALLTLPALMMYSPDQQVQYKCKLSLRVFDVLQQIQSFIVASNLRSQIISLVQTNEGLSYQEASKRIGESYARIDFRKNNNPGDVKVKCFKYTLNQEYLRDFEQGYKAGWDKLANGDADKQKTTKMEKRD